MSRVLVGNTHIVAGGPARLADVRALVAELGVSASDPDLYVREYRSFGIDEAREITERASMRPVGERRVFAIAAPDMTREAQNALLKTLEESGALFFIVVPSPATLLPTVRSRAQTMVFEDVVADDDAQKFLAMEPARRLDALKPLLEKTDEGRDLSGMILFLASLERVLARRAPRDRDGLRAIYRARRYIADKGALAKPLLEQVALLVGQLSGTVV